MAEEPSFDEEDDDVALSSNPFLPLESGNEFAREAAELKSLPAGRRTAVIAGRLVWIAVPLFTLQIASWLSIVTDVVFAGRWIGTTALAAMGLSTAYGSCVSFIAYNISTMGLFSIISQGHGRDDVQAKGLALQTALLVGAVVCIPVGVLLFFTSEILGAAGNVSDPELLRLLSVGGKLAIPGTLFECLYRVFEAALTNQRFLTPLLIVQFGSLALNAVFNGLFVVVLGWGYAGSVIGTSLMRFVRFAALVVVFFGSKRIRESAWTPWSRRAVSREVLWLFVKHSVPSGLAVTLEIASFEAVSFFAAWFGVLASSVHVTVFQVLVTAFFFIFGVTNAVNVVVGNLLGANQQEAAMWYAKVGAAMTAAVTLCDAALVLLLRPFLPRLFTEDPGVIAAAIGLMPLVVAVHVPDSCNQIEAALLRAAGASLGSTVSVISGLMLVSFPLGWYLGFHRAMGLAGLWIGLACGAAATSLVQGVFLWRIDWRKVTEIASSQVVSEM
jgi:MATE family multidrug resistance protein